MFLCTNILNPQKRNTSLKVSAGHDVTVTKNDTINFIGIFTSNVDIEIFNWYILRYTTNTTNTGNTNYTTNTTRQSISRTQQLQCIAPDSACTLSFVFRVKTVDNVVKEDTVIAYVVPDTVLNVNAGQDQTVLVDLPVVLRATYIGDNIINTFWKIGPDNFIPASPETSFTAPENPLLLPCIFKVTTSDNREAKDTVNMNVISIDSLRVVANAGNDTITIAGSQLTLHGTCKGKNITHTFWKIGDSDFTPAPLDTTITLPDTAMSLICILKVQDLDLKEAVDPVIVTVVDTNTAYAHVDNDTVKTGFRIVLEE